MARLAIKRFCADFENTVPKTDIYSKGELNQVEYNEWLKEIRNFKTDVWAWGIGEVMGDPSPSDVSIGNNIGSFFKHLKLLPSRSIVYFHNLAYDAMLLLSYLVGSMHYWESLNGRHLTQHERAICYEKGLTDEEIEKLDELRKWKKWPERGSFSCLLSGNGTFYSIKITFTNGTRIEIRDSLKILPFSVDKIAKDLKTKAQKLKGSIDYSEKRHSGWNITETEEKYLKNDVLVMMEALQMIEGYKLLENLTIASTCMQCFKTDVWDEKFLKMKKGEINAHFRKLYPVLQYDEDKEIRKAYRGGWCYVDPRFQNKIVKPEKRGEVYDVNSLYPSVMYDHTYPVGPPHHFEPGEFEKVKRRCYFVKVKGTFKIKPDHHPFIQIKNSKWADNEYITDQDELDIELVLARPDYELFLEQYDPGPDFQIVEGWWFMSRHGIFDKYVNHWYSMKSKAKEEGNRVLYMLAKLFLNSLYGKFAMSPDQDQGHIFCDNGVIRIYSGTLFYSDWDYIMKCNHSNNLAVVDREIEKSEGVYIPIGAYITAYARGITVRAAQKNYNIFCYADTDSIHLTDKATGIPVSLKLGEWENETSFNVARFVRQKTYIERVTHEDGKEVDPYLNIKACGATQEVKERLKYRVTDYTEKNGKRIPIFYDLEKDEDGRIISEKRTDQEVIDRFTYGLIERGKLMKKRVHGGTILAETTYQIREPAKPITPDFNSWYNSNH